MAALHALLTLAYPVAVWWAVAHRSTASAGFVVLTLLIPMLALRVLRSDRTQLWSVLRLPLSVLALMLLGMVLDEPRFYLALPVLISVTLFAHGAASLHGAVPLAEQFARLHDPEAVEGSEKAAERAHYRQATKVWTAFFALNAVTCAALAVAAPLRWWLAYTSGVAYVLMFLVGASEHLLRKYRFRSYGRGPQDRALALLWPPRCEQVPVHGSSET